MNAEELVNAVEELEHKLERLRVLFEQYFQGIEKIPPSIPQKDVDRRIWVLRRERIRNTGTRFKFQQLIQRYNTLGSYWMRISREIENGTYKRDILRAKKRFGIDASNPKELAKLSEPPPSMTVEEVDFDADDLLEDDDFAEIAPTKPKGPPARPAPPPMSARSHAVMPPAPSEVQQPPIAAIPAPPAASVAVRASSAAAAAKPRSMVPERPSTIHPSVPKILAKKVSSDDDLDDMLNEALGPSANAKPNPKPAPIQPKPAGPVIRPASLSTSGATSGPAATPGNGPASPADAPAAAARPNPAVRPNPNPALKPQTTNPGGDEFRRVYSAYVDAKRKNGESTAGVTYENLAKSLQETRKKLADRAGGKSIEFEVTVKDGKTILKPVVR